MEREEYISKINMKTTEGKKGERRERERGRGERKKKEGKMRGERRVY